MNGREFSTYSRGFATMRKVGQVSGPGFTPNRLKAQCFRCSGRAVPAALYSLRSRSPLARSSQCGDDRSRGTGSSGWPTEDLIVPPASPDHRLEPRVPAPAARLPTRRVRYSDTILSPPLTTKGRGDCRINIGDLARLMVEVSVDLLNRRRFWPWLFSLCRAAATMGSIGRCPPRSRLVAIE